MAANARSLRSRAKSVTEIAIAIAARNSHLPPADGVTRQGKLQTPAQILSPVVRVTRNGVHLKMQHRVPEELNSFLATFSGISCPWLGRRIRSAI
jgi:hypothetical protein